MYVCIFPTLEGKWLYYAFFIQKITQHYLLNVSKLSSSLYTSTNIALSLEFPFFEGKAHKIRGRRQKCFRDKIMYTYDDNITADFCISM